MISSRPPFLPIGQLGMKQPSTLHSTYSMGEKPHTPSKLSFSLTHTKPKKEDKGVQRPTCSCAKPWIYTAWRKQETKQDKRLATNNKGSNATMTVPLVPEISPSKTWLCGMICPPPRPILASYEPSGKIRFASKPSWARVFIAWRRLMDKN